MEKTSRNILKENEILSEDCRKRSTSANSEKSGETPVWGGSKLSDGAFEDS